jgi:hypothetical protein
LPITTASPSVKPCAAEVVTTIGVAFVEEGQFG